MEILDCNGEPIEVGSVVTKAKANENNKYLYRVNNITFSYGKEPVVSFGEIRYEGKDLEVEYLTKSEEILYEVLIKNNRGLQVRITRQELEDLVERIAIRYVKEQQEDID
jgi:hypothetical protein